jgi:hypothetical protein
MPEPKADQSGWVDQLASRLGADWQAIRAARHKTKVTRARLESLFADQSVPDTSLVVFGSVAREEETSASDLDWKLSYYLTQV